MNFKEFAKSKKLNLVFLLFFITVLLNSIINYVFIFHVHADQTEIKFSQRGCQKVLICHTYQNNIP